MQTYIACGWGFDVGPDFARAKKDTPVELAPNEYAKPGFVIGYIKGVPDSPLGFLRASRVRVHVSLAAIVQEWGST